MWLWPDSDHLRSTVLIKRRGQDFLAVVAQRKTLGWGWKWIHEEWEVCTEGINPDGCHQALCSPPVYLITEDRDHITLGRVTHSERGGSIRHCMVTVIWDYYGWYRKVTLALSLTSHQTLHISTCCHQHPRRAAVFPSRLWTLINYCLKEWVWFRMSSLPLVSLAGQEEVQ